MENVTMFLRIKTHNSEFIGENPSKLSSYPESLLVVNNTNEDRKISRPTGPAIEYQSTFMGVAVWNVFFDHFNEPW